MSKVVQLVLATRNEGKMSEMRAMLAGLPVQLLSTADFPGVPEVVEDAGTLEGNARKKATALHACTGLPALADDTGLEVEALDGRPGVHSARYAGAGADDAANRALLVEELEGVAHRKARFRTVMAYVSAVDEAALFEGICEGRILREEKGTGGFGYDPLFQPDGEERTFAQMPEEEKNAISHRGRAVQAFITWYARRPGAS